MDRKLGFSTHNVLWAGGQRYMDGESVAKKCEMRTRCLLWESEIEFEHQASRVYITGFDTAT